MDHAPATAAAPAAPLLSVKPGPAPAGPLAQYAGTHTEIDQRDGAAGPS
jgi:hypothetical protein